MANNIFGESYGSTELQYLAISTISEDYTLTNLDCVINVDGDYTITLPLASENEGKIYHIKNISTEQVTVKTSDSELIDGSETALIKTQYESIKLISDGTGWSIL